MIERHIEVGAGPSIEVRLPAGSLVLDEGPPGIVAVTLDTDRPEDWRVEQSGDTVVVAFERSGFMAGGRATVRISTPPGAHLKAETAAASLSARVELGEVAVSTASGDVRLQSVGSLTVKTASGDVVVAHIGGDLAAKSASGEIEAGMITGSAAITTASGDVDIEQVEGDFAANSASGDIRVKNYLGEDLEVRTMSGDITFGVPSGTSLKLTAKTMSGDVRMPERRHSHQEATRHAAARVRSVSGDIRLQRTGR